MTDRQVRDCVEVQVVGEATDLTALRPSPRRDFAVVAARAEALGLTPHRVPRAYRLWPILITAGVAIAYLVVALVVMG